MFSVYVNGAVCILTAFILKINARDRKLDVIFFRFFVFLILLSSKTVFLVKEKDIL